MVTKETLKEFRMKVLNQEKIIETLKSSNSIFEIGLLNQVNRLEREFESVVKYLPEKSDVLQRISSVKYDLEDISSEIRGMGDSLYFDEYSAQQNEARIDLLSSFKRKYGSTIDEINAYLENIRLEYEKLKNSEEIICKLEQIVKAE